MMQTRLLNKLLIIEDNKDISIKDYNDDIHILTSDPGDFSGVFFNKEMKGLESLKLIGDVTVNVLPRNKRVPPSFFDRLWDKSPNTDYGYIKEPGLIKGVLENDSKDYTHCLNNIYNPSVETNYCAAGSSYYKTNKCNENCPFYQREKVYLTDVLNSRFFETLAVIYGPYTNTFEGYAETNNIDPEVKNLSNNPMVLENTTGLNNTSFLDKQTTFNDSVSLDTTQDFFLVINKFVDFNSPLIKRVSETLMASPVYSEDILLENYFDIQTSKMDVLVTKRDEINETFDNVKFKKNNNELPVSTPTVLPAMKRAYVENDVTYVIDVEGNVWVSGREKQVESYEEFYAYEMTINVPNDVPQEGTDVYIEADLYSFTNE
jgi:hypothetical protein